jgi:two-component system, NarL family, response regulator NreC
VKPTVLLADDHAAVREALGELLRDATELVGQVSDGRQLVESARRLRPDIIVTDVLMPVMTGLDAMRQLIAEQSTARFIILTVDSDVRLSAKAMCAGASGYLLKLGAGDELLDAIDAVMSGRTYLSRLIMTDPLSPLPDGR